MEDVKRKRENVWAWKRENDDTVKASRFILHGTCHLRFPAPLSPTQVVPGWHMVLLS